MQRAGARETRTCLWGGGGERGRVAESWDNRTRRNCVAPNVHPTPLQVMLRGRGPGNQPGYRGRGHVTFGERVDLRPHRLRSLQEDLVSAHVNKCESFRVAFTLRKSTLCCESSNHLLIHTSMLRSANIEI